MFRPLSGHLQGGDDSSTNTVMMCRNHFAVKNVEFFVKNHSSYSLISVTNVFEVRNLLYGG